MIAIHVSREISVTASFLPMSKMNNLKMGEWVNLNSLMTLKSPKKKKKISRQIKNGNFFFFQCIWAKIIWCKIQYVWIPSLPIENDLFRNYKD